MTRDDNVKIEKDILKEIAQNKEYKNKILQNLPNTLYKKACLCGLISNEEQGDNHEEMERLLSLCSQSDDNQNEEKGGFADESFDDCSLSRNNIKLKYFLIEEIFDFLEKSNSKIFSEQDILTLLNNFFVICSKNKRSISLTSKIVTEYKTMNSFKKRFLGYFCADFEDVCLFDISNQSVHSVELLKDTIFINPRANNNWSKDKYDAIIVANFDYKIIGEEEVCFDDGMGLCPPDVTTQPVTTIDFTKIEGCISELLIKLKDSKNLFCSFTYVLPQEEKVELKRILTKNDISLKALIKFDNYSYLGAYDDYGEDEDSLVNSHSILLLEKHDKTKGNQAYVLSQINNYVGDKVIKNLVETIKKGKRSSSKQNETTIVEIISPNVDYVYGFEEIINKNKPLKAKQQQIANGLISNLGKDLIIVNGIKSFNIYKGFIDEPQSFYVPINPKVFRVTGISTSISEMREKVFNSNLIVADLAFDKIPWYQHVSKQYKDYCENDFKNYPLNGAWNNLVNNIDIRERNEGGDIISYFLSKVGKFRVDKTENEVVISGKGFVQRVSLENEIDKYNSIKNQIVQASCVQVPLNKERLLMDFFVFLLEYTESGKEFLQKWEDRSDNGKVFTRPIDVFQKMKILLPSLDKQQLLLRELSQIDKVQELLKVLKSDRQTFINWLDGHNKDIILKISNQKSSLLFDNNSSTYEFLPQSLASILYLDEYEDSDDYARKCRDLLLFFEATAQFHATILLSEFCLDKGHERKVAGIIRKVLFNTFSNKKLVGETDRYIEFAFTFGTWTTILSELITDEKKTNKLYDNNLHDTIYIELKKAEELFKNKRCLELIKKAKSQRNEEAGHTNNKTIKEDKELYMTLKNLADQITGCLVQMYSNVQFICINGIKGLNEDKRFFGGIAKGANPRLRYVEIEAPDSSLISLAKEKCQPYIKKGLGFKIGKDSLLPVVPLIKYVDLLNSEDMLKSTYFVSSGGLYLDNIKESWISWKSYDLGRFPRREESYETDNTTKYLLDWIYYSLTADIKNETEGQTDKVF